MSDRGVSASGGYRFERLEQFGEFVSIPSSGIHA
jgi:hypothetical protein